MWNVEKLVMSDAQVFLFRDFFTYNESVALFRELSENTRWRQHTFQIPSGQILIPRLMAYYGDPGKIYTFSGITLLPEPWNPTLLGIKTRVEAAAAYEFNSVLLNLYRNESESVSWHSDDEAELGMNPTIASISLGEARLFEFKHKHDSDLRVAVEMSPGSLLLMQGSTQHFWKHQLPRSKKPCRPRINLTFRAIKDGSLPAN
jgi:alkylated DNA repair dioxygenase AlkB